jgi:cobalamin transport system ATP-binding protein
LSDEAIRVSGVSYGYGREEVIKDLSLAVRRGEMLGIIGPNGSGKSTLLRLMSGVLRPWQGRVEIEGRSLEDYKPRQRSRLVAVVPQDTAIPFPFSVMEVVLLGRTPHLGGFGFEGDLDVVAARRSMQRTGVLPLAGRAITELSGGERQRVFLARALAQEAQHLLLDEPAAFLDIRYEVEMYDLLRDLRREGMTIAIVLHDLNLAALYCDRVALLHEGCLAQVGTPSEVMTYPTLTRVYGTEIYVTVNDITGRMNILPLDREQRDKLRRQFGERG